MKLMMLFFILLLNMLTPNLSSVEMVIDYIRTTNDKSEQALFIDMSIPSNKKRLFLVELSTKEVIYSTYVAHGKGSGQGALAIQFSDSIDSYCTSLGLYKVGKNYQGKHGDSYELIGLEKSNANALERSIVMHAAWYASEDFIRKEGRCGNSWGCPAVSEEALKTLKPFLDKNILVYIYK